LKSISRLVLFCSAIFIGACANDPNRLLGLSEKLYNSGKYKDSTIVSQRVIQTNPKLGRAYWLLAIAAEKLPDRSQALAAYRRAYELQPGNNYDAFEPLIRVLMSYHRQAPDRDGAINAMLEVISQEEKRNPKSIPAALFRGEILLEAKRYADALIFLRRAWTSRPDDPEAAVMLSKALAADGQAGEAEQIISAAGAKHKDSPQVFQAWFDILIGQRQWDKAERVLNLSIENKPESLGPRLTLAEFYLRRNMRQQLDLVLNELLAADNKFPTAPLDVGQFYIRLLDPKKAIEIFRQGIKRDPTQREQYQTRIVEALLHEGDLDGALGVVAEILKQDPKSAQGLALRGTIRLAKEPKQALEDLRTAVNLAPQNGYFRYALGIAEKENQNPGAAEANLSEAAESLPRNLTVLTDLCAVYLNNKQFTKAISTADQLLAISPDDARAGLFRADAMMELNLWGGAREQLEKTGKVIPDHPDLLGLRAKLATREGKLDEASALFQKLGQVKQGDRRATAGLFNIFILQGKFGDAQALLQKELRKTPNDQILLLDSAELAIRMKNTPSALKILEPLLEEKPADAKLNAKLGRVWYFAGNFEKAEPALRKAFGQDQSNLDANLYLGNVLAESGRLRESIPYYDKVLQLSPLEYHATNNLAFALAETGVDLDRALSLSERAVSRTPDDPMLGDTLGWVYYKKGMFDTAVTTFRRYVQKAPENATLRYHLALALTELGQKTEARAEAAKALASQPGPQEKTAIEALVLKLR
jgi:tetratricopeptide (TPR) repeat protein